MIPVSLLMLLHVFRIDKGSRAKTAWVRLFSLVLRVNVTVKEAFSTKLGSTFCARIPPFSQVNMPNVSVQILLLVESEKRSSIFCSSIYSSIHPSIHLIVVDLAPQTSHWKGFSPEWTLLWLSSSRCRAKFFPHILQSHGLSTPCTEPWWIASA